MSQICISGPVIRQSAEWDLQPWVKEIYQKIEGDTQLRRKVLLPRADRELEKEGDGAFFHAMRQRISTSKALITVFTPGDVSAAIETCMASLAGKNILVIAEDPDDVPRLLRGMPGVKETMTPADFSEEFSEAMVKLGVAKGSPPIFDKRVEGDATSRGRPRA